MLRVLSTLVRTRSPLFLTKTSPSSQTLLLDRQAACEGLEVHQTRNTWILKRKWTPPLNKLPRYEDDKRRRHLPSRFHVYELVEHRDSVPLKPLEVLLVENVEGIGMKGDIVKVKLNLARDQLLPSGQAVYCSPENLEDYADLIEKRKKEIEDAEGPTRSAFVETTLKYLQQMRLNITMNRNNPWTITKNHIAVSFRKAGVVVPEYAITMPNDPITSDNPRDFEIQLMVNRTDEVTVPCHMFLYASGNVNRAAPDDKGAYGKLAEAEMSTPDQPTNPSP
ncbi:PREDICTED: 39S ribosomal protein L9, mitochondrial-like isoform X1 [Priapulus caudatus]|uniref:Large ribosomal subunit protein bL9m n=1 Tax=Priapulus caudatus TaxID=37621 RepID=A0ABM1ECM0_PRICU|nr:PREDICTED: 39S ribosomal protein L9, mitochondrial-like isoform X1 [Priapulus caudatus]